MSPKITSETYNLLPKAGNLPDLDLCSIPYLNKENLPDAHFQLLSLVKGIWATAMYMFTSDDN